MASNFSISGKNTTIGVVATNVKLTKAQATKVAGMAHDGLARCIRPIHTSLDGDTIFCLSTGELEFPENSKIIFRKISIFCFPIPFAMVQ